MLDFFRSFRSGDWSPLSCFRRSDRRRRWTPVSSAISTAQWSRILAISRHVLRSPASMTSAIFNPPSELFDSECVMDWTTDKWPAHGTIVTSSGRPSYGCVRSASAQPPSCQGTRSAPSAAAAWPSRSVSQRPAPAATHAFNCSFRNASPASATSSGPGPSAQAGARPDAKTRVSWTPGASAPVSRSAESPSTAACAFVWEQMKWSQLNMAFIVSIGRSAPIDPSTYSVGSKSSEPAGWPS
mmetsp:Transcript_31553/g.97572  ORF Transcript_31553/g.97572 Transcript_31553/m.97572 type:complete len:241 (-) Transcript_31553:854-1576(-)